MNAENARLTARLLRDRDRDRYLATLVLPEAARAQITALYAFNAEVASIRERVSEPGPGEIRLQWWSDALGGDGHGAVRANPVADCLLETIKANAIPTGTLQRLLNARRFDLYDDPMPDIASFEGYAGETTSTLYQLAAMVLNGGNLVEHGDAAGHLGVAQAMIGHLRAFGYNAAMGRLFLPWSILEANGVVEGEIFSGTVSDGLVEAIGQITELAGSHLAKAESAIANVPSAIKPVFAPVAVLRAQLQALKRNANGPFVPPADAAGWRKIAHLAWWTYRNR